MATGTMQQPSLPFNTCSVDGCEQSAKVKGMCKRHYLSDYRKNRVVLETCSIDGCQSPVRGKGLCSAHYQRWRTHGDPLGGGTPKGAIQKWIDKSIQTAGDECLPWPFSKKGGNVGTVNYRGQYVNGRRLICELAHGPAPTPEHISSHIGDDNCACVNPNHLEWRLPGGGPAATLRALQEAGIVQTEADRTSGICVIEGCDRHNDKGSLGLCGAHYKRLMRHGNPLDGRTYWGQATQWLKDHVSHTGDDCLIWPFGRSSHGYACIDKKLGSGVAHRVMCMWAHGEPPESDLEAIHTCGNGHLGCVNPSHLAWGTHAENMAMMVKHGRSVRGEKNWKAILTESEVREIRRLAGVIPYQAISDKFGITTDHISAIYTRAIWDWLD